MSNTPFDEVGPVDYVMVEFPAGAKNFTGEMAAELLRLVDAGTIRIVDVLILDKNEDGSVDATELSDIEQLGEMQAVEAQLAELLASDDVASRRRDGTGQHCRCAHLREPVGRAVRVSRATLGRPAHRQRTDPDPGDHRLGRGRSGRGHAPAPHLTAAGRSPTPPPTPVCATRFAVERSAPRERRAARGHAAAFLGRI
jgi:hypothetical protein